MANLEGGDFSKFMVIKREYLTSEQSQSQADLLSEYAHSQRFIKTREINPNTYLVINTDELYIDEIIEILKKNGHWG